MSASPKIEGAARQRRRADARRSVEAILDAAVEAFGENHEVSMAEIARRAGVVRATIYVHFPTRAELVDAVTSRAMSQAVAIVEAAEPQRGDPAEALRRVVAASWQTLGRYHPLIALNVGTQTPEELHAKHGSLLDRVRPLIERGQAAGVFRADVPADWHLAMVMAIVHAGSAELSAGRVPHNEDAGAALVETVLGAVVDPAG